MSKTPGGQQASAKFQKQQAATHGIGADNAPGHTEGETVATNPGKAPIASDSGATNVGVEAGKNNPGEKDIKGVVVDSQPSNQGGGASMKS